MQLPIQSDHVEEQENLLLCRSQLSDEWNGTFKKTLGVLQNDVSEFLSTHPTASQLGRDIPCTCWKNLAEKSLQVVSLQMKWVIWGLGHSMCLHFTSCSSAILHNSETTSLDALPFSALQEQNRHFKSSLWEIFLRSRAEEEQGYS